MKWDWISLFSDDNPPNPRTVASKGQVTCSSGCPTSTLCLLAADLNCIISQRLLRSLQRKHMKLPPVLARNNVLLFSDSLQLTAIKVVLICVKRAIYREHCGMGEGSGDRKKVMNIKCKCHTTVIETYNNSKGNVTFWPETPSWTNWRTWENWISLNSHRVNMGSTIQSY